MSPRAKFVLAVAAVAALSFTGFGVVSEQAGATPAVGVDQANPTITITNEGVNYVYSPDKVAAKAGQAITITNKDPNGVHSVTAKDHSFSVDVPPQSSVTLTVPKAGNYPYYCQYHPDAHNPASITVS
jgi:plastocyanin